MELKSVPKTVKVKARGIVKPVEITAERAAIDRRIINLEREIEAVEWAFAQLEKVKGGADIKPLAEMLYKGSPMMSVRRAAFDLYISEKTAFRYNRAFLKLVAARLGLWAPLE